MKRLKKTVQAQESTQTLINLQLRDRNIEKERKERASLESSALSLPTYIKRRVITFLTL